MRLPSIYAQRYQGREPPDSSPGFGVPQQTQTADKGGVSSVVLGKDKKMVRLVHVNSERQRGFDFQMA
jgi:hypothetical protein